MIDRDDDRLFEGLELEEPSAEADARVLELARSLPVRLRRPEASRLRAPLTLLAAAAVLSPLLVLFWPLDRWGSGPESGVAEATSLKDLEDIRSDLDQIKEMAELISPEREAEQEKIDARVEQCLLELERLEVRIKSILESSSLFVDHRKGVNL